MTFQRDILVGKLRLVIRVDSMDGDTHSALCDDKTVYEIVDQGISKAAETIGDELTLYLGD